MEEVIGIYYVYRFLDKNKAVIYLSCTKHLEREIRNVTFSESLSKRVSRIEYIRFEEEADAEMSLAYFISVFDPDYIDKDYKAYDELSLTIEELDNLEWTVYERINNFKWRKDLIREVHNLRIESREMTQKVNYILEKKTELLNTTIEFESNFHKETLKLDFLGVFRLIEEMTDNPPRRRTFNYWETLSNLKEQPDLMVRALEIEPIEMEWNKKLFFRTYNEYTDSLLKLEEQESEIKRKLFEKEKLLDEMEVV